MRGKETPSLVVVRGSRITPAYAGKSLPEELEQALPKDHPRVCGEKACMQCTLQGHGGSPPRMRGKGRRNGRAFPGNGITPAYAGKSILPHLFDCAGWDHPRVCGEKFFNVSSVWSLTGSPPRMRGKGLQNLSRPCWYGITPAYAGKSYEAFFSFCRRRDHPRVCGEKAAAAAPAHNQSGSPPRMRGKERQAWPASAAMGITPAYAGKRVVDVPFSTFCWDHPRVCGEKDSSFVKYAVCIGSPPRMRGKAKWELSARERARITPAYAGKSYPQDPHST